MILLRTWNTANVLSCAFRILIPITQYRVYEVPMAPMSDHLPHASASRPRTPHADNRFGVRRAITDWSRVEDGLVDDDLVEIAGVICGKSRVRQLELQGLFQRGSGRWSG